MEVLQPFIFIVLGLVAVVFALRKSTKNEHLKKNGLKTEGIIFQVDIQNASSADSELNSTEQNVLVRFTTNADEWITEPISQDHAISFAGQYKQGDKLIIYYNPTNPKEFYVDSKQSEFIGRLVPAILGLIIIGIGLFKLLVNKSN
jgi:Protein of unknown function (DUF3592)